MTKADVQELLALPIEERVELAEALWQSIEQEPLADWQRKLLEERLAEHRRDPEAGIPWEEVRRELWPEL